MTDYEFTTNWTDPFKDNIRALFQADVPLAYLEVGVYEGRSACFMLDNVLTHPDSHATLIETWAYAGAKNFQTGPEVEARARRNLARHTAKVTIHKGDSKRILPTLAKDSFDVAYIDGSHEKPDCLVDALLAWPLLKTGGMMLFDDYRHALTPGVRLAMDQFLPIMDGQLEIVLKNYQLVVRKTNAPNRHSETGRISVVLPVWHGLNQKNVDSLLAQTTQPFEVICVFDGIDAQSVPDGWKVRSIAHSGPAVARNHGYANTSGDLIFFLDDDTLLTPDCLKHMKWAIDRHGADFAYCDYQMTGARTGLQRGAAFSRQAFEIQNRADCCSLVRRGVLPDEPFDPEIHRLMDWDLWLRVIKAGGVGRYVPLTLFTKDFQNGDISTRNDYDKWFQTVKQKHGIL